MEIHSLFDSLLEEPSIDKFLHLRKFLVNFENYSPYSRELDDMKKCVATGDAQGAIDLFRNTFPNLLISPAAHLTLSATYECLGNKELTDLEKRVGFFLIGAIMKTGDGTRQHPYLVARISDEYDVLSALGKERGTQELCSEKSRFLDVQTCLDGTQVCFDVTDPYLNQ
jgi:hypothetical protein